MSLDLASTASHTRRGTREGKGNLCPDLSLNFLVSFLGFHVGRVATIGKCFGAHCKVPEMWGSSYKPVGLLYSLSLTSYSEAKKVPLFPSVLQKTGA